MKNCVLIVEDSEIYQKIISQSLSDFETIICSTAEEAAALVKIQKFSLVIVDINLPMKDGFYLINEIHAQTLNLDTPILCLTGRNDVQDKIMAFDLGVDDYLTKPFDPRELKARVESKIKKSVKNKSEQLSTHIGDLQIDFESHRLYKKINNKLTRIDLTHTEFKLLSCLVRMPEQVFTREDLLIAAWGKDVAVLDRVIDVHICLLRKKIGESTHTIKAVSGLGYKLTLGKKNSLLNQSL